MRTLTALLAAALRAQAPANPLQPYISVDSPVVAITNVTVIDGTGAAPQPGTTVVMQRGRITAVGKSITVRAGALVIDGHGKTLIPGMVGMHDHLFYTAAGGREVSVTSTRSEEHTS